MSQITINSKNTTIISNFEIKDNINDTELNDRNFLINAAINTCRSINQLKKYSRQQKDGYINLILFFNNTHPLTNKTFNVIKQLSQNKCTRQGNKAVEISINQTNLQQLLDYKEKNKLCFFTSSQDHFVVTATFNTSDEDIIDNFIATLSTDDIQNNEALSILPIYTYKRILSNKSKLLLLYENDKQSKLKAERINISNYASIRIREPYNKSRKSPAASINSIFDNDSNSNITLKELQPKANIKPQPKPKADEGSNTNSNEFSKVQIGTSNEKASLIHQTQVNINQSTHSNDFQSNATPKEQQIQANTNPKVLLTAKPLDSLKGGKLSNGKVAPISTKITSTINEILNKSLKPLKDKTPPRTQYLFTKNYQPTSPSPIQTQKTPIKLIIPTNTSSSPTSSSIIPRATDNDRKRTQSNSISPLKISKSIN